MSILPSSIERAIEQFARLPGIGPKSAARLVFYLLSKHPEDVKLFGQALSALQEGIAPCKECFNWSEQDLCPICENIERDDETLMVVGDALDVVALEKTGYRGRYFVLGGVIIPIQGIGPEQLRVKELIEKVRRDASRIKEVILALDPSLEGDATTLYLSEQLRPFKLRLTRIARGVPTGSDLEYADQFTLQRSLEGRQAVE